MNRLNGKFIYINERLPSVEAILKQNAEQLDMITSTKNCSTSVLCNKVNDPSRVAENVPYIGTLKEPVRKNDTRPLKLNANAFRSQFDALESPEQRRLEIYSSLSPHQNKESQRFFN